MKTFAFLRVHFQSATVELLTRRFWSRSSFLESVEWWNYQAERMDRITPPPPHSWLYIPLPDLLIFRVEAWME